MEIKVEIYISRFNDHDANSLVRKENYRLIIDIVKNKSKYFYVHISCQSDPETCLTDCLLETTYNLPI
jgi:hypothetical protein